MKTLCLKLPEDVAARLAAAARKSGRTKSAVARAILSESLVQRETAEGSCLELAGDLAGCVDGARDLSVGKKHLRGYGQ
jgi:predicted transcriptional regulator